ncbi:methyltransferase domain-containing protein [Streptomyces sp. NPDC086835]|uniref:methyltransferase domain-containing protein n=1 Tax=Streptomyces sp. NPDC086835 TaxID=3365761 RepID=UPI0037F96994
MARPPGSTGPNTPTTVPAPGSSASAPAQASWTSAAARAATSPTRRRSAPAVGVHVSFAQPKAAEARWADSGLVLHRADAVRFLEETGTHFDTVYSVFGAAWFTNPEQLLPVIRQRLKPGGVFAQRPPIEDCYGCQASYSNRSEDEDPLVLKRWDSAPGTGRIVRTEDRAY